MKRYKNCVIFYLWNYHLRDEYPEIQMHAMCILNVVTNQFRLWNNAHFVNDVEIELNEVIEFSEKLRIHIIEEAVRIAKLRSDERTPTGVTEFGKNDYYIRDFVKENYVGNPNTVKVELTNQYEAWLQYQRDNSNPKIVKTTIDKIDPYYMQRFKRK